MVTAPHMTGSFRAGGTARARGLGASPLSMVMGHQQGPGGVGLGPDGASKRSRTQAAPTVTKVPQSSPLVPRAVRSGALGQPRGSGGTLRLAGRVLGIMAAQPGSQG